MSKLLVVFLLALATTVPSLPTHDEKNTPKAICAPTRPKEYHLIEKLMNWHEAERYCHNHGMHLASVTSKEEKVRIDQLQPDGALLWISGTDLANQTMFYWQSTGCYFGYQNWSVGEPSGETRCVATASQWYNFDCGKSYIAVCEKFLD